MVTPPSRDEVGLESPVSDSGLRCPTCRYNLTGVAENRCPECGEAFDPQRLREILRGAPSPIPVWDDKETNVFVRLFRVCVATWVYPARVGRGFPPLYSSQSARCFRWVVILLAILLYLGLWAASASYLFGVSDLSEALLLIVCFTAGVVCCEAVLSVAFRLALGRRSLAKVPRLQPNGVEVVDSWAGLIGMFRSFVIITVLAQHVRFPFYHLLSLSPISPPIPAPFMFSILWWWLALGIAVGVQPVSGPRKALAILLIPVAGAVAIAAAFVSLASSP